MGLPRYRRLINDMYGESVGIEVEGIKINNFDFLDYKVFLKEGRVECCEWNKIIEGLVDGKKKGKKRLPRKCHGWQTVLLTGVVVGRLKSVIRRSSNDWCEAKGMIECIIELKMKGYTKGIIT